jgi:cell division protease FtsH
MNNFNKNILLWVLIFVVALGLTNVFGQMKPEQKQSEITYSDFLTLVDEGTLSAVTIRGNELTGTTGSGESIKAQAPYDPELITDLREKGVNITAESGEGKGSLLLMLINWFPWLLFIGIWIYFMRQMQGGAGKAFSFGKSKAKMLNESQTKVTFADVAGVEEAKDDLEEVVDFLKDPTKFQRLGGRIPKGVLLVGPPGTGKTLLARAVAGEAGVPFFSISGSDFVEMFVGVGAARVRDLFEQGKRNAPCIIFIDEIDAVGRHRGAGLGGGNDEREQTLNQMLVEMDGFEANEGVILVAATNRPDVLDPALLRPGRFDRQVTVPLPDIEGRTKILEVHMQKVPLGSDVDASVIARGTPGFSGADLANLVNESALQAARQDKRMVDMADFEFAKDKIMMGAERRSAAMTEDQKKTTAYHEAGHAILSLVMDGEKDPLHKVTIIPRGRALGVTMSLPEEDKVTYEKAYLENQICMLFGGRLAEELILSQMTTGASNDIEKATDLARRMVTNWGMSKKLGPINYGEKETQVFLGRDLGSRSNVAEGTALEIDAEVRGIIDVQYARAEKLLKKHEDKLHVLAKGLLEYETLDRKEVDDLLAGKKIVRKVSRTAKRAAESKAKRASAKKASTAKKAKKSPTSKSTKSTTKK